MLTLMQTLRTPDDRFTDLPEFPYTPRYSEVSDDDGGSLRMAWVEEGPHDADAVLMLHGEPSWSFLYRKMIPVLTAAGYRVVCPDLVGCRRSVPHLQRLLGHLESSLKDLERAAGV